MVDSPDSSNRREDMKKSGEVKKQLTVRIPSELLRGLKVKAASELRTISAIVEDMLRREVANA